MPWPAATRRAACSGKTLNVPQGLRAQGAARINPHIAVAQLRFTRCLAPIRRTCAYLKFPVHRRHILEDPGVNARVSPRVRMLGGLREFWLRSDKRGPGTAASACDWDQRSSAPDRARRLDAAPTGIAPVGERLRGMEKVECAVGEPRRARLDRATTSQDATRAAGLVARRMPGTGERRTPRGRSVPLAG
jgi:hypothetical protein